MAVDMKFEAAGGDPVRWDPYDLAIFADPYATYRRLREEAPLYYDERYDFYAVSRYDDVQRVLGDRDTFSSRRGDILEMIKRDVAIPDALFIFQDAPRHAVYRTPITRVFTPKRVAGIESKIRAFCARALDPFVESGEFDFVRDLGLEMPLRVIGMVLGIPDQDLKAVQKRIIANMRTEPGKPAAGHNLDGETYRAYLEWRLTHPSDDLMTELLNLDLTDETGQRRKLDHEEILVMVNMLAAAGNETTNHLIGWIGKVLGEHPDQRRQIVDNPALIPQAIEEVLRFEPPSPIIARYVTKDAAFEGGTIPEGSVVVCLVASANRDVAKFADGERFDIHRQRSPHLSFGYGFHACLGNALARVEGRIALEEVLKRFPDWEVDLMTARLDSSPVNRGWASLPAYAPRAGRQ
jgi:cytochrome P450